MNLHNKEAEIAFKTELLDAMKFLTQGELELDYLQPDNGNDGWYAMEYIDGYGAVPIRYEDYSWRPILSKKTEKKYNIDVRKICNSLGIAYCG